ncbi:MAG TPA: hypothetical protein VKQ31_12690 [Steroidobacteraceae bacterium]|nr:hypothetical protein [Steroidobacteraceae bacterium]
MGAEPASAMAGLLLARLREFGSVHRGLAAAPTAAALSAGEQSAVADYVSRLPGGSSAP